MALRPKRWQFTPPAPPALFDRFPSLHPLVVQALYGRGLSAEEEVGHFLAHTLPADRPFDLPGVQEAVRIVRQSIERNVPIAVYGDYDADGVTATALMVQTLTALGARVQPYIPDRHNEGYGLNGTALQTLAADGVGLLLTVDCGIRSAAEVALAKRLGMTVIVTDHHHLGEDLPPAAAVINPRREDNGYPYRDFAGVGVAYKLAQALLRANREVPLKQTRDDLQKRELLDLVALGTVADLVPLLGENHVLVREGLDVINEGRRPGLAALMQVLGIKPGEVRASTIAFVLAPRLNAAGRLEDAMPAYELLRAPDFDHALKLARKLEELNRRRRDLTSYIQLRARTLLMEEAGDGEIAADPLLFVSADDFHAGVVGLAAGRLADEFHRPAVVVEEGPTFSRASARSIPGFHIARALDQVGDLLERYGGHAGAAGFTVRTEHLPELKERLIALACTSLDEVDLQPVLQVDAEVPLHELSWEVLDALETLAPFGCGNRRPVFVSRGLGVRYARAVGREGRHLKLRVMDERGKPWDVIAFRQGEWMGRLPDTIDLAYHLERNEWNGRVSLQLNAQDIHAEEA
jgi:single-stranded-DNA-specific exonuclease